MATPKKFFHDHWVLLLLSVNAFFALVVVVSILLQLGNSNGYIVQYRPSLGIGAYETGSVLELFAFIAFSIFALVAHTILSRRAYPVRRQLALVILGLGVLLQVLAFIISYALLSLVG